jgi:thiamine kinase
MSDTGAEWASAERAARLALSSHADTTALTDARFVPIADSLSNYAWRASTDREDVFVRLARAGTEALGANLQSEAGILQQVSAAGLAPAVIRCDPAQRLLVTRWIEPRSSAVKPGDPSLGRAVAAAMSRLHRLPTSAELRRVDFAEQARLLEHESLAETSRAEFASTAAEVFSLLAETRGAPVLCHHDIHAQNIVIDGTDRLWLVDWEYAGLGDPIFDLASFSSQCHLAPEAAARLCNDYARAGGDVDARRLEPARWAFDYVQWLWYRRLQTRTAKDSGHEEALRRSDRLERRLLERASAVLRCNNR